MPTFSNTKLDIDVDIVKLKMIHAVKYWEKLDQYKDASGPAQWNGVLQAAKSAGWFMDESLDPMDLTPAQARWLAEEIAAHLLEQSTISDPEV
tara:strand:- start:258 stop:536 length:279 start_codon:yes stop_codon:yes gene_type:complete